MVGRLISFWETLFSGGKIVLGRAFSHAVASWPAGNQLIDNQMALEEDLSVAVAAVMEVR